MLKEHSKCRICLSEKTVAVHLGVIVCTSCIRFFHRWLKRDQSELICRDIKENCELQSGFPMCSACRFKKCVSLNMYNYHASLQRKPYLRRNAEVQIYSQSLPNSRKLSKNRKLKKNPSHFNKPMKPNQEIRHLELSCGSTIDLLLNYAEPLYANFKILSQRYMHRLLSGRFTTPDISDYYIWSIRLGSLFLSYASLTPGLESSEFWSKYIFNFYRERYGVCALFACCEYFGNNLERLSAAVPLTSECHAVEEFMESLDDFSRPFINNEKAKSLILMYYAVHTYANILAEDFSLLSAQTVCSVVTLIDFFLNAIYERFVDTNLWDRKTFYVKMDAFVDNTNSRHRTFRKRICIDYELAERFTKTRDIKGDMILDVKTMLCEDLRNYSSYVDIIN